MKAGNACKICGGKKKEKKKNSENKMLASQESAALRVLQQPTKVRKGEGLLAR